MATEVRIPVRLEVLQDSISGLQKILNGLQPNTANFKAVEKIINQMTQEAQKLQAQLSRPFTNEGQFRTTNKTLDKLEESAARIQVIMGQLQFSDLKLTPAQQESFDQLNSKINEIKTNYTDFLNKIKEGVISNSANKQLVDNLFGSAGTLKANFDEIKQAIDDHIDSLASQVEREKAEYDKMRSNAELAERASVLTSTKGGITRKTVGNAIFDQYLYENQYGIGLQKAFQTKSGTSKFLEALEQEFKLDPGALKSLIGKSFDEINKAIQEMSQDGKFDPFEKLKAAYNKTSYKGQVQIHSDKLEELRAQLDEYRRLQNELNTLKDTKVTPADTQAQNDIKGLEQQLKQLEDQILKTATAGQQARAPFDQMANGCSQLRTVLEQTNAQFLQMQRTTQTLNSMRMAVVNFMGFNQVLNLTKTAIRNAINHIKELDTVMNKISIVTDMDTSDLWAQVDQYSRMAQAYGTTIKGAYEVSQIYYQQGLNTNDVLTLTNETLKLAKVSGLDYAQTTDYMTTALRGFKMEMSEASTVVDVYSNLAANTAVSQEELAVAMSKTASSMESVGATFEESSAMIATMVAVTRESATNIGSALKSIASRYGELKSDPSKLIDAEGEVMSFNKVDTALQSVGISLKTTEGQFRDFTDVILELSEKWDELDSTQQRYIATQFAGNRQQSRFLALVSNADLLKANIGYAEDSEDVGTLQALKALDSVESKLNQVQVAYQQFYTTMGFENVWKGFLDGATNVINTLNSLPKLFGKIPTGAIAAVSSVISLIKSVGISLLSNFAQIFGNSFSQGFQASQGAAVAGANSLWAAIKGVFLGKVDESKQMGEAIGNAAVNGINKSTNAVSDKTQKQYQQNENDINILKQIKTEDELFNARDTLSASTMRTIYENQNGISAGIQDAIIKLQQEQQALSQVGNAAETAGARFKTFISSHKNLGNGLQSFGAALNMIALTINTTNEGGKTLSGTLMSISGAATLAGIAIKGIQASLKGASFEIPWLAAITGIMTLINGISTLIVTPEERLEELTKKAEDLSNKAKETKAEYKTLDNGIKKIDELSTKRSENVEAAEEYQAAVDDLADKFPELISGFDAAGNIMINTTDAETVLTRAREKAAKAAYDAAQAELDAANTKAKIAASNIKNAANKLGDKTSLEEIDKNRWNTLYNELNTILRDENTNDNLREQVELAMIELSDAFPERKLDVSAIKKLGEQYKFLNENDVYKGLINNTNDPAVQLQTALTELSNMTDYSSQAAKDKLIQIATLIHNIDWSSLGANAEDIEEAFGNLSEEMGEALDISNIVSSYKRQIISGWQKTTTNDNKAWTYLEESASAAALTTNAINEVWRNYEKEKKANFTVNEDNYDIIIRDNGEKIDYMAEMEHFWNQLNNKQKELFEAMFSDVADYTAQDFDIEDFNQIDNFKIIYQMLLDYYDDGIKSIQKRLNESLAKSMGRSINETTGEYDTVEFEGIREDNFFEQFSVSMGKAATTVEENVLNSIMKQYNSMSKQGNTTRANQFGLDALKLFNQLSDESESITLPIWDAIKNNGINTLEGIEKVRATIESSAIADEIKIDLNEFLNTLSTNIIPNISLSMQSLISGFTEGWSDASKTLSNLSAGLDLADVENVINQAAQLDLGDIKIDFDSFKTVGNKLVLAEDAAQAYWTAYFNQQETQIQNIVERYQESMENLDSKEFGINQLIDDIISEDKYFSLDDNIEIADLFTDLQIVLGDKFKDYVDTQVNELGEVTGFRFYDNVTLDDIDKALAESNVALDEYQKNAIRIIEWQRQQIEKATQWKKGDYSTIYESTKNTISNFQQLFDLTKYDTDLSSQEDMVKEGVTNIQNGISTMISDLLNNGKKYVSKTEYEGINKSEIGLTDEVLKGSYASIVTKFVENAGKSISEANDLIAQAIEKDTELKSVDLLKDFTFFDQQTFGASLQSLKTFANKAGVGINEILNKAVIGANEALDQYVVDLSALLSIATDVELDDAQLKAQINDSIRQFQSDLIKKIQSGISGSLSETDMLGLQKQAWSLGMTDTLDFTSTAEGLQLTSDSLYKLYATLKVTNAESAKKLLPNIKSMTKEYDNVIDAMKAWSDAAKENKPSSAGKQEVAKETIIEELISGVDAYDWTKMSTPLQLDQIMTYYESMYAMDQFVSKSAETKTADYSSFSKILSFIQAQDQTIGGKTGQQVLDYLMSSGAYKIDEKTGKALFDLSGMDLQFFTDLTTALDNAEKAFLSFNLRAEETSDGLNKTGLKEQFAEIKNEVGDIDYDTLIKKMQGGEINLEEAFSGIKINGENLYDILFKDLDNLDADTLKARIQEVMPEGVFDGLLEGLADQEGKFNIQNTQELLQKLLGDQFKDIPLTWDLDGSLKLEYKLDNGKVTPIFKIGDQEVNEKTFQEWSNALTQENAQVISDTTMAFSLGKADVTVKLDEGKLNYTTEINGKPLSATTLTELKAAIIFAIKDEDVVGDTNTPIESGSGTMNFTVSGQTYTVTIDGDSVIVKDSEGNVQKIEEQVSEKLLALYKGEEVKLPIEAKVEPEVKSDEETPEASTPEATVVPQQLLIDVSEALGMINGTVDVPEADVQAQILSVLEAAEKQYNGDTTLDEISTVEGTADEAIIDALKRSYGGSTTLDQLKDIFYGDATDLEITSATNKKYTGETNVDQVDTVSGNANVLNLTPEQIVAAVSGIIPTLTGILASVPYTEPLAALLQAVDAIFNGIPTIAGVNLSNFDYNNPISAILKSIRVIGDNVTVSEQKVTLAEGANEITTLGDIFKAIITHLNYEATSVNEPTLTDLGLSNEVTLSEQMVIDVNTQLNYRLSMNDEFEQLRTQLSQSFASNGQNSWIIDPNRFDVTSVTQYAQAMAELAKSGKALDAVDLEVLQHVAGTSEFKEAARGAAQAALDLSAANSDQLKTTVELLSTVADIKTDGIASLSSNLSGLASALSVIAGISIDQVIDTLSKIKELSSDDLITNLNLELNISDSVSGGFETLNSAIVSVSEVAATAATNINTLANKIKGIPASTSHDVNLNVTLTESENSEAKGNVTITSGSFIKALSFAKGKAKKEGTLMGELGPELVVSNGHYFIVGQSGAEFVDLDPDAIVFNHIQTERLMSNGHTGRGKPITNERIAAGMAHGNWSGGKAYAGETNGLLDKVGEVLGGWWKQLFGKVGKPIKPTGGGTATPKSIQEILETLTSEQQSKLASLMSDLITKGFDKIDWEAIEKSLGAELTAELKKEAKKGSLRDFIQKYGDYCGKTLKEINDLYFQAWEAELGTVGETFKSALEGLSFFGSGSVGGGSADWSTVLSQYGVKIGDLVDSGILKWNEDLGQFMLTNTEDLWEKFHIDLTGTHGVSSLTKIMNEIDTLIGKALSKGLDEKGRKELESKLSEAGIEVTDLFDEKGVIDPKKLAEIRKQIKNSKTLSDRQKKEWLAQLDNLGKDEKGYTDGLLSQVKDSQRKIGEQINELLGSAFEGTLGDVDKDTLTELLGKNLGLDKDALKNLWKKTENGWELDTDALKTLQDAIDKSELPEALKTWLKHMLSNSVDKVNDDFKAALAKLQVGSGEGVSESDRDTMIADMKRKLGFDTSDINKYWTKIGDKWYLNAEAYSKAIKKAQKKGKITDTEAGELTAAVEDSLRTTTKEIADAFESLVSGELSSVDLAALKSKLTQYGLSSDMLDKYLSETADGWAISLEGLNQALASVQGDNKLTDAQKAKLIDSITAAATELIDNTLDSLSKALEGTLSKADLTTLQSSLKRLGLAEIDSKYLIETVDGYAITIQGINQKIKEAYSDSFTDAQRQKIIDTLSAAIQSLMENLVSSLSKAFEGTLRVADLTTLQTQLRQFGLKEFDLSKDLIETVDGYAITIEGISAKIKEIKKDSTLTEAQRSKLLNTLQDAISTMVENLISSFDSAIAGTLKATDITSLETTLQQLGIVGLDVRKYLVKTVDGYAMTLEGLQQAIAAVELDDSLTKQQKAKLISTLKDSGTQIVNNLTDSLSKAMEGTLSQGEFETLNTTLQQLGLKKITKGYQETADGIIVNIEELQKRMIEISDSALLSGAQKTKLITSIQDLMDIIQDNIISALEAAVSGALTHAQFAKLNDYLKAAGIDQISEKALMQTSKGLVIDSTALQETYRKLLSSGQISHEAKAQIRKTIAETDSHYKSMSSTMKYIVELQEKITEMSEYSDEKKEQYKEELALLQKELDLAKEIAAVRATSKDESFNFLENELPAGLNNPLNYAQSWATAWKTLHSAIENGTTMDFKTLYNMLIEMNNQAKAAGTSIQFFGYKLDGSAESLDKLVQAMSQSMGYDNEGNFGVLLGKLGGQLTDGATKYADGADNALKTMAKSQIKILDALIQFFEAIVALEKFEGADKNENGLLDLGEIFKKSTLEEDTVEYTYKYKKSAKEIMELTKTNKELETALSSVKIGNHTLKELVEDATDGIFELGDMTADEYQKAMSTVYEMVKSGNYDLDDIAQSLIDQFKNSKSGYEGTIEIGDMIYDVKTGIKLTMKDGKYTAEADDGSTVEGTDSKKVIEETKKRNMLAALGAEKEDITIDEKTGLAKATVKIGKSEIEVKTDGTQYIYNDVRFDSIEALHKGMYNHELGKDYKEEITDEKAYAKWKIDQGITVVPKLSENPKVTASQAAALVGKTRDEIVQEWKDADTDDKKYEFEIKYGFKLDNDNLPTEEEWDKYLAGIGIEKKNIDLAIHLDKFSFSEDALEGITDLVRKIQEELAKKVNAAGDEAAGEAGDQFKTVEDEATEAIGKSGKKLAKKLSEVLSDFQTDSQTTTDSASQAASDALKKLQKQLDKLSDTEYISLSTDEAKTRVEDLIKKLKEIKDLGFQIQVSETNEGGGSEAKGNVALAAGRTLVGELGPELVVSRGHYYTVGNHGAEMVNLPKDAIVFNHLQTQRLLANGSTGRGTPVVSEAAAVAQATGNAMATASETLATLKTLRAMWQSLEKASVKDLISTAATDKSSDSKTGAWLKDVERWYNILQKVARLEKEINKYEAERNLILSERYAKGKDLFDLDVKSLENYMQQAAAEKQLSEEQKIRFDKRKEELNAAPMSAFYTYDDYGQLKYKDQGFAQLESIIHQTDEGKTLSPQQQLAALNDYAEKAGIKDFAKYYAVDASGLAITREENDTDESFAAKQVQAIWERMEAERTEIQNLYDSYNESNIKYLELTTKGNEILQGMLDNQKELEEKVLTAIEQREQGIIDKLTDERQALSESFDSYINGLTDALNKERQLYENENNADEISKLQRQIAILQRSGGSASQIASLQKDLASKQKDAYFDAQQEAIDAAKDAADLQLEKLQEQIDLMTETLEYEKENGLLWAEVHDIMQEDSPTITDFITQYSEEWKGMSQLQQEAELKNLETITQQWEAFRTSENETLIDALATGFQSVVDAYRETNPVLPTNEESEELGKQLISDEERQYTGGSTGSGSGTKQEEQGKAPTVSEDEGEGEQQQSQFKLYKMTYTVDVKDADGKAVEKKTKTYNFSTTALSEDLARKEFELKYGEEIKTYIKKLKDTKTSKGKAKYKISDFDTKDIAVQSFMYGGDVDYTGYAKVHGTPDNPELMLNASETKAWKQDIVGSGNNSLMSRLYELRNILGDMESVSNKVEPQTIDSGITIESASVNMYVQKMDNDYDAKRAGDTALEEILRVARKTGTNRIGR